MKWESYRKCDAAQVPAWVRWHESEFSPKGYVVWYGGTTPGDNSWGAPFRRIVDEKGRTITYYRFMRGLSKPKERE